MWGGGSVSAYTPQIICKFPVLSAPELPNERVDDAGPGKRSAMTRCLSDQMRAGNFQRSGSPDQALAPVPAGRPCLPDAGLKPCRSC